VSLEPSIINEMDIRAKAFALLKLMPLILALVYILTYSYASQFLAQFGLTPEEVGISEVELLTRAGFLGLVVVSIYGLILVVPWLAIVIIASLIGAIRPRSRRAPTQSSANAVRKDRLIRIASTAVFALAVAIVLLLTRAFGLQLNLESVIFLGLLGLMLIVAFYVRCMRRTSRSSILRSAAVIGLVVLGWASYFGGAASGIGMAERGHIPPVATAFGVDVLEVHPVWLDRNVIPAQYLQGQDFLELGSDSATVFLYDCRTGATYRVAINEVVLTYPLSFNKPNSLMQHLLYCR
jgi:hypothetical protein